MALDDGPGDREADSHALRLGREHDDAGREPARQALGRRMKRHVGATAPPRDRGLGRVPWGGLREQFRRSVVEPYVDAYAAGATPNPCVRCNASFRFDELLAFTDRIGASTLVTGHYARIVERGGRTLLARALDAQKDQSYMLATIDPGIRIAGFDDRVNVMTGTATIRASVTYLRDRIGKALSIAELSAPLTRLGFGVQPDGDTLVVTVPEWRNTGDVSGPHDLVEEIARLHGYERFDFQAPVIRVERPARHYAQSAERRVKEYLAFGCGLQEVITYPWIEDRYVTAAGYDVVTAPFQLAAPPAPDQVRNRPEGSSAVAVLLLELHPGSSPAVGKMDGEGARR